MSAEFLEFNECSTKSTIHRCCICFKGNRVSAFTCSLTDSISFSYSYSYYTLLQIYMYSVSNGIGGSIFYSNCYTYKLNLYIDEEPVTLDTPPSGTTLAFKDAGEPILQCIGSSNNYGLKYTLTNNEGSIKNGDTYIGKVCCYFYSAGYVANGNYNYNLDLCFVYNYDSGIGISEHGETSYWGVLIMPVIRYLD